MIITALGIYFNVDRTFQSYILDKFPNYGVGLTGFEDNELVQNTLEEISQGDDAEELRGKPMFDVMNDKGIVAPEIIPGGEWFNLENGKTKLDLKELRGKVVVIDFWTYTCINCIRTLPYLKDWYATYKDKGLVIIGVHTPEFEFEKDKNNLAAAIEDYELSYPIVQDNNYATWKVYDNRYWPAKYFIDKDGRIRHTHFGEGKYDESERVIQELLKETGAEDVSTDIDNPSYQVYSNTPETYLGYARIRNFASFEKIAKNKISTYSAPAALRKNQVAYTGDWLIMDEYANPQKGAQLKINFEAKEVFLVMRSKDQPGKMKVHVDGEMKYFGEDNINGEVVVESDRLYKLIKLPSATQHILRLEFSDSNIEVFAFTFG